MCCDVFQKRLFKAKVLRKKSMKNEAFHFNEIASKVMDWNPDQSDVLQNVVTDDNLLRVDGVDSFRGSKQKSPAFMESMIEICTERGSAVLDLTAGVGMILLTGLAKLFVRKIICKVYAYNLITSLRLQAPRCPHVNSVDVTSSRWRRMHHPFTCF